MKKIMKSLGSIWIVLCLILPMFAIVNDAFSGDDQKVAKVIILKGTIKAKNSKSKKAFDLKRGQWLEEGTTLQSGPKSFAKLLFIDKSQMSLGPNSKMAITQFPTKKAGVITLLKGQLRSKVSKDYLKIQNKDQSKLFIKTKTAAMGVRGTDFQVNYNIENKVTSLITFEGRVAMAKIDNFRGIASRSRDLQKNLEKIVSSKNAVLVTQGQYSGVTPKQKRASIPVKISPVQLDKMKKSDGVNNDRTPTNIDNKKKFRNPIPPGVDSKKFVSDNKGVEKEMSAVVGKKVANTIVKKSEKIFNSNKEVLPPPEGFNNRSTGEYAPPAGGYVDPETALYIPPPPGSTFDSNAGMYIPPPEMGKIDDRTGDYIPPEGVMVDPDKGLVLDMEMMKKMQESVNNTEDPNRDPASTDGSGTMTTTDKELMHMISTSNEVNPVINEDVKLDSEMFSDVKMVNEDTKIDSATGEVIREPSGILDGTNMTEEDINKMEDQITQDTEDQIEQKFDDTVNTGTGRTKINVNVNVQ